MRHRDVGRHAIGPYQLYSLDYAVYHSSRCNRMHPLSLIRAAVALDPAIAQRFALSLLLFRIYLLFYFIFLLFFFSLLFSEV